MNGIVYSLMIIIHGLYCKLLCHDTYAPVLLKYTSDTSWHMCPCVYSLPSSDLNILRGYGVQHTVGFQFSAGDSLAINQWLCVVGPGLRWGTTVYFNLKLGRRR
jgi:hypothetical protein